MRLLCADGSVETNLFWVHVQTLFAGEMQGLIIKFLKNKCTLIETQTSAGLLIFSAVYISIVTNGLLIIIFIIVNNKIYFRLIISRHGCD